MDEEIRNMIEKLFKEIASNKEYKKQRWVIISCFLISIITIVISLSPIIFSNCHCFDRNDKKDDSCCESLSIKIKMEDDTINNLTKRIDELENKYKTCCDTLTANDEKENAKNNK